MKNYEMKEETLLIHGMPILPNETILYFGEKELFINDVLVSEIGGIKIVANIMERGGLIMILPESLFSELRSEKNHIEPDPFYLRLKLWDPVLSPEFGWGQVQKIRDDSFCLEIEFLYEKENVYYTHTGRRDEGEKLRQLFYDSEDMQQYFNRVSTYRGSTDIR